MKKELQMYEVNIEKANENENGVHNSLDNLHDNDIPLLV